MKKIFLLLFSFAAGALLAQGRHEGIALPHFTGLARSNKFCLPPLGTKEMANIPSSFKSCDKTCPTKNFKTTTACTGVPVRQK